MCSTDEKGFTLLPAERYKHPRYGFLFRVFEVRQAFKNIVSVNSGRTVLLRKKSEIFLQRNIPSKNGIEVNKVLSASSATNRQEFHQSYFTDIRNPETAISDSFENEGGIRVKE